MRIRTQLIASSLLAGLVALLVAGGLLYVTRQTQIGLDEQADSEEVARDVANMVSLTNEFTLYGSERAAAQWRSRHAHLREAVARASQRHNPAYPALVDLQRNVDDLAPLFEKLVQVGHEPANPLAHRRRDLLLERLLTETQELIETRHRWAVTIGADQQAAHRLYKTMVLAAPAALLLLLVSLGVLIGSRVLRPLGQLQANVNSIRDGDLAARCDTGVRDELGDAARAVDSMTATLQHQGETLAQSNASLSREIAGRRESEQRLRLVTDHLPALVSYLDREQRFRFANRAYRDWLDLEPDSLVGCSLSEVYGEQAYAGIQPHMASALAGTIVTYEREFSTPTGVRNVQVTVVPQRDEAGSTQGLVVTIHDITERKLVEAERAARQSDLEDSLREKEVLLKEIHHRVKNNLQVISSLLQLQAGYIEDEQARQVFEASQGRIRSMALVHEKLYQAADLAHIDFGEYLRDLLSGLGGSYGAKASAVRIDAHIEPVQLDVDRAIPAGLVVNELVSNAFKHGFPGHRTGCIQVGLRGGGTLPVEITVCDDGVGWPAGFDPSQSTSLGLRLVHILAKQLQGELQFDASSRGVRCALRLRPEGLQA